MTLYPYRHPAPFKSKLEYSYAPYQGGPLFDGYFAFREESCLFLSRFLQEKLAQDFLCLDALAQAEFLMFDKMINNSSCAKEFKLPNLSYTPSKKCFENLVPGSIFNTRDILVSLFCAHFGLIEHGGRFDVLLLKQIAKKLEVFQRLAPEYSLEFRAVQEKYDATICYALLGLLSLWQFREDGEFRHLNTCLKVGDLLSSIRDEKCLDLSSAILSWALLREEMADTQLLREGCSR